MNDEAAAQRPILYPYFDETASELLRQYERSKLQAAPSSIGDNRERFVDQFLSKVLPSRLQVKQRGEIWDSRGTKSGEVDIVILRDDAPSLEFGGGRDVFLAEGVFAVIEVKSNLTRGKLEKALSTLRRVRSLDLSGAHPAIGAGPALDRPLRCVFAYEGATWPTLQDELSKPHNSGMVDLISVLDRGSLVSAGLLPDRKDDKSFAVVDGRAASLAWLYFFLVSYATTFMARVLEFTRYFEPAEGWHD